MEFDLEVLRTSIMNSGNILDRDSAQNYTLETFEDILSGISEPYDSSGRFGVAFKMNPRRGGIPRCYRVWKDTNPDAKRRSDLIDKGIRRSGLRYFSGFRVVESALRVTSDSKQYILPGIVMDWIEGDIFSSFLTEKWRGLSQSQRVEFIRAFYRMCMEMRDARVSHGDLSCKNIIVTPSREIRLVDYDSVWVSEMGDRYPQTTAGIPSFQHPLRFTTANLKSGPDDDNFSQLVIAISLWTAYYNTSVVDLYADEELLFKTTDFGGSTPSERKNSLMRSDGWKRAMAVQTPHMKKLMDALLCVGQSSLSGIPSLMSLTTRDQIMASDFVNAVSYGIVKKEPPVPPKPKAYKANFCVQCGAKFNLETYNYCTVCGAKRATYS